MIAAITAAVTAGGPAIAASIAEYAQDSDKVDGRDAVSARTTAEKRAHQLVATNGRGTLPNDIIRKAANADSLDGMDSGAFAKNGPLTVVANGSGWMPRSSNAALHILRAEGRTIFTRQEPGYVDFVLPLQAPIVASGKQMQLEGATVCLASHDNRIDEMRLRVYRTENGVGEHFAQTVQLDDQRSQGCTDLSFGPTPPDDGTVSIPQHPVALIAGDNVMITVAVEFDAPGYQVSLGAVTARFAPVDG